MNAYIEIGKSAMALVSEANKVTNELYDNRTIGGFFSSVSNVYSNIKYKLDYSIETQMQDLMRLHGCSEAMFKDFKELLNRGYFEFDPKVLPELEHEHKLIKASQRAQFVRKHGIDTQDRKRKLSSNEHDLPLKTELVIFIIEEKSTDFSIALMRHYLLGDLFRPTPLFETFYNDIFDQIPHKPSLKTFFRAAIRGAKKVTELLDKYLEVIDFNTSSIIQLKKEEVEYQVDAIRKKTKLEHNPVLEKDSIQQNCPPKNDIDNTTSLPTEENKQAQQLGKSMQSVTQQDGNNQANKPVVDVSSVDKRATV